MMKEILTEWKKFLKEQQEEQEKQTTGQELTLSDEVYAQLVLIIMAGAYKLVFENHFTNKNINFMHKVKAVWPYQQIEQAKQENENIREMFKNIFSYLPKNKRKYLLKDSNHFSSSPYYVKSNPPYFSISEIIVNRLKEDENKNINSITNIRLYVPPFDAPAPRTDGIKLFAELVYPELKGTSRGKSLEKESVETREGQGLSPSYDAAAAEKTAVGSVEMLNTFKSYGKILTLEDEEMKRSFAEMLSAGAADISYIKQVEMLLSSF